VAQPGLPPWEIDPPDGLPPWETDPAADDPEWETRGAVQINRRTGQKRPTPQFAGAAPGLGKLTDPYPGEQGAGSDRAILGQLAARVKESVLRAPETAQSLMQWFTNNMTATPLPVDFGAPGDVYGKGLARDVRESVRSEFEQKKDDLAQHFAVTGGSPVASALADTGLEAAAIYLDPTNRIPITKGAKAARGAKVVAEALPDAVAPLAKEIDPALAEVAKVALDPKRDEALIADAAEKGVVSPGFGDQRDAARFTAWLEKNGVDVTRAQAEGQLESLGREYLDLHEPLADPLRAPVDVLNNDHPSGPSPGGWEVTVGGKTWTIGGKESPPLSPDRAAPADLPGTGEGRPPRRAQGPLRAGAAPADEFQYNVDRLGIDDSLKPEIQRILHEDLKDKLPAYGGGQISGLKAKLADPEVIKSLALKTGLTPEDLLKKRPGWVLDTTGAALLDASLTGKSNELEGLVRDVAGGKIAPADLAAANERIARLRYERNTLLLASSGNASEQGRALGARRFTVPGLSREDSLRIAIQRKYQMSPAQIDALAKLDPTRPEDVNTFLRGIDKPNVKNMVTSLWRASIMSGEPTQLRNLLGNTTQLAWEMAVRPVTAVIDAPLAKMAGRAPEARVRDVVPAFVGLYDGGKAGAAKAWEVLRTGATAETAGKLDTHLNPFELVNNPIGRWAGKAATEPVYRTLSAVDTFFRTMGWTSKQYETAARLAAQEGKPLAEMMTDGRVLEAADSFARRITYTDEPSRFAKGVAQAAKGLDDVFHIPVGTFAVPFTSVPDRVMARAFEATPMGLMSAAVKAAKRDPAAAEGLAKGAIGTWVAYWAYGRAKDGLMTGANPEDSAVRSQRYALGATPWSANIGGHWIPYSQLGPLGFTMAMAAQVADYNRQTGDDVSVPRKLAAAGLAAADFVLDQSYVDNAQKITEVIHGHEDVEDRLDKLGRLANQTAAGFIPYSALQRNFAQALDPRVTDSKTLGQTIEANTPGMSPLVPAKLTPWGEPVVRQETPLGAFLPRNTPLYGLAQRDKPVDPVEAELARIGVAARFAPKNVGSERRGTRRPLSEEEWRALQTDAGQASHARIQALIASPAYQALKDVQQAALVKRYLELEQRRSKIKLFGP